MDPYDWDEAKNAANVRKHGVGFELVREFDWSVAILREDLRYDYGETRMMAYSWIGGLAYAVAFVVRGDRVRIISMRRMHRREIRRHGLQEPPPAAAG
jgi:uncharacterized DUF497 family protein